MRIYLDAEFTGLHQHATLISIGMVAEDDRTFYAEFNDYDDFLLSKWIRENIINKLTMQRNCYNQSDEEFGYSVKMKSSINTIKIQLIEWLSQFKKVEIWSDCLAYDWVLFNNIFGTAFDIPKNVYYIPFDISTVFKMKGIDPDINREKFANLTENAEKHNALWDAKVIKECYNKLFD